MRRLSTLALGAGLASFAAALAAQPAQTPASDPGGGAIPIPPANSADVTADLPSWGPPSKAEPASAPDSLSDDPVARGRYLAVAGDCMACHTNVGGAAFAGARPIPTPFGIVY